MDKRRVNKLVREIARGNTAARFFAYGVPAFVSDNFSAETYICGYYVEGELALAHWDVGFGFVLSFARAENDALYFAGESANVAGTVLYTNGAEGAYLYAFEYGGLYYYCLLYTSDAADD